MGALAEIADLLNRDETACRLLAQAEGLKLPDCWIGAGFVRNAVWDALHGIGSACATLPDIDVIYFDVSDVRQERDVAIEQRLQALSPDQVWSVKNQARMHLRNGDAPYRDSTDAVAHWPETATAIAARSIDGRIELTAPHGVEDLLGLVVRPTSAFAAKMDVYRDRVRAKNWLDRWPRLTILGLA